MKKQNHVGMGPSIRWAVSFLLVFAALSFCGMAKAADYTDGPADDATIIKLPNLAYRNATFDEIQLPSERGMLNGALRLVALQGPALYCYTTFGAFPMAVAMPVGYSCHVQLPYYPFTVVNGVTGY